MNNIFPILGFILFIGGFIFLLSFFYRSMRAFNRVIKFLYENLKEGQPFGMFWRPSMKNVKLKNRLFFSNPGIKAFQYLFFTPDWVKEHPEAMLDFREFRKFSLYWNIGIVLFWILYISILVYLAYIN